MTLKSLCFMVAASLTALAGMAQDYPLNFDPNSKVGAVNSRSTNSVTLKGSEDGDQTIVVAQQATNVLYFPLLQECLTARPGEKLTPEISINGDWMNGYLYLDRNNDGKFDASLNENMKPAEGSDVMSFSNYEGRNTLGRNVKRNTMTMPAFKLPEDVTPGVYRLRFKVDWSSIDPGGNDSEDNKITDNGGCIVDVPLLVHADSEDATISWSSVNGTIILSDGGEMPADIPSGDPLTIAGVPDEGYRLTTLDIVYGRPDLQPQHGTPTVYHKELKVTPNAPYFTIPGQYMVGEVTIKAIFDEKKTNITDPNDPWGKKDYLIVWADEFDLPDGSHPDMTEMWTPSPRNSSAWNRFNTGKEELYVVEDGILNIYAHANTDKTTDKADFITGAIQTSQSFGFTYGVVESRMKTVQHRGNFPAFWMMPVNKSGGWPSCGEIDIFETIDSQNTAYHTIHGPWNPSTGSRGSSKSIKVAEFHTYSLEWEENKLTWYIDGQAVFTQTPRAGDNWPFNKHFYVIINQAVGNGSWAAAYDPNFEYCTSFDYVRIYQKEGAFNTHGVVSGIRNVVAPMETVSVVPTVGGVMVNGVAGQHADVYDMSGRLVKSVVLSHGDNLVALKAGCYVIGGKKALVR